MVGRSSDLFGTRGAAGLLKKVTGGLKGVENIYTQHTPLLAATLDQLAKGKLKVCSCSLAVCGMCIQ